MIQQTYKITGSIIQAYLICPRQAWLMSRQVTGNQYNEFMAIGRLISEQSYGREKKEIRIGSNVIDVVKTGKGGVTLVETKKSSRALETAKMQLLFYMYDIRNKVKSVKGEIRVPKEKQVIEVELTEEAEEEIKRVISEIEEMLLPELPPKAERNKYCGKCSQEEFCWA